MTAAWMLVSVLLGGVIVLGALALEAVCRATRMPVRWTWVGALGLSVCLTVLVPLRRIGGVHSVHFDAPTAGSVMRVERIGAAPSLLSAAIAEARGIVDAPVAWMASAVTHVVPPALDRWLLIAWIACSLALLVLALTVFGQLVRAQRTWPIASMHGERVHVAPHAGPAVLGFLRGAIVVPHWLDACTAEVQTVVLAHEREHVRARDPLLLALGTAAVVLLPWNPGVWWMLARLRLAVELDCDRRVLGAGVRARDYGTLLIDLAGRSSGIPLGAPLVGLTMLAERTTHLERRIVAMSAPRPRHAALRIAAGSLVALTAVLAACEAKMPTSVDVDNMTAASAERAAAKVGLMDASDSLRTYYIDGKRVTAADARALAPGQITSIMISEPKMGADTSHMTNPKGKVVWIETRNARTTGMHFERKARVSDSSFAGLVFIDGNRSSGAAMTQINPADIASIQVIKGARAAALYPNDPAAAQGVIQITTKNGAH